MSAGAAAVNFYEELADGGVRIVLTQNVIDGFLAVTDGTVTEEALESVKGVSSAVLYTPTEERVWSERAETAYARFGEDTVLWHVSVKPAYLEIREEYGQYLTMELDGVLDVLWLEYEDSGYGTWNGELLVGFTSVSDAAEEQLGAMFAVQERAAAFHAEWEEAVDAFESSVDLSGMTAEERKAARQAAGILTDYEMMLEGEAYAAEILSIFGELDVRCKPEADIEERRMYYDGASVWNGIGDCNLNGTIDAVDAADILKFAAASGSGGTGLLSAAAQDAGNVNRDELLDAEDASLILRYAAESGSGKVIGWGHVL